MSSISMNGITVMTIRRVSDSVEVLQLVSGRDAMPTEWELVDEDGWYRRPSISMPTQTIPGGHGSLTPEEPTYNSRFIMLDYRKIVARGQDVRRTEYERFSMLEIGVPYELIVRDPIGELSAAVWLSESPDFAPKKAWWLEGRLEFFAPDPRKYRLAGAPIEFDATPSVADGLSFPLFTDGYLSFGAFVTVGDFGVTEFVLRNDGSMESWPIYRLRGPIQTGFSILTDGGELRYSGGVPAESSLTLSPYAGGRAVLDGVDVTEKLVVADWVPVGARQSRQFKFVAAGLVSGGAGIEIDFREADI